ncbi:MAG: GTPase ObgE [Chloroflexota bacterium]|nr:GTPase ObgE [Chloroflexota bacterium]
MYYDEVEIYVKGGHGGNGAVAFRREKYIPYGGPSGGNGGRGGDVILVATRHRNTLFHLRHRHKFVADSGEHGRAKQQYGADAEDLLIEVPTGTLVTGKESGAILADLTEHEQRFVIARGGKGGRGNMHFATSTRQTPRISERGDPGEERDVRLELKLLADIGLVGKPNAGKSTLLSVTTSAEPKIAAYPFTTLQPNLGVVALDAQTTFVMADVPGLIEGASEGKGLGHEFLRHIERTGVLIHMIDGTVPDPVADFKAINAELSSFGHKLMDKQQLVAVNKLDMPQAAERFPAIKAAIEELGYPVLGISAITHQGVRQLLGRALQMLEELPAPEPQVPTPVVIRPDTPGKEFTVERSFDGFWVVAGGKIERAVQRTNLVQPESVMRLHRYLKSKGVLDKLRQLGVQEGDLVRIGEYELEWRSHD